MKYIFNKVILSVFIGATPAITFGVAQADEIKSVDECIVTAQNKGYGKTFEVFYNLKATKRLEFNDDKNSERSAVVFNNPLPQQRDGSFEISSQALKAKIIEAFKDCNEE
jgi:hypothetical protein